MPFTPLHMGPGLAIKALAGRHVSLTVFGFSQVLLDIDALARMLRGDPVLHGFSHTYAGALLVGLVAIPFGKVLGEHLLGTWNLLAQRRRALELVVVTRIPWSAAASGALLGSLSHVALDSIMHADMRPLMPLGLDNPWLGMWSIESLHVACLSLGMFGALGFALRVRLGRSRDHARRVGRLVR